MAEALKDSPIIIPVRERTKFNASLLRALPDLEYISQTGNHVYHVDMDAAAKRTLAMLIAKVEGRARPAIAVARSCASLPSTSACCTAPTLRHPGSAATAPPPRPPASRPTGARGAKFF